jgi:hypothetical protein
LSHLSIIEFIMTETPLQPFAARVGLRVATKGSCQFAEVYRFAFLNPVASEIFASGALSQPYCRNSCSKLGMWVSLGMKSKFERLY